MSQETIREKIARQIAEENEKAEARRLEQEKKLQEADDKTVEKYKKLAEKANKKADQYFDAIEKLKTIAADYDTVVAEVVKYQNEIVELGRDSELVHVKNIHTEQEPVQDDE